jgi:hypothetical protein
MKTKFLLALLTLNGLLFSTNSALATTGMTSQNSQQITTLSQTISKSIDLTTDYQSLVELAINRALLAKGERPEQSPDPQAAGGIQVQTSEQPLTNGRVAQPQSVPTRKPIINGITIPTQSPQPHRSPKGEAIINGTIVAPNRR